MLTSTDLYDGQIISPYNKWADTKLSTEMQRVKVAITGNPLFPDTTPDMNVFGAAVDAYILQLAKAATHGSNAIAAKNARRVELIELAITLGHSVSNTAKGNLEALISTGLPLKKKRQKITLTAPVNLRIINGLSSGELILKVDTLKGALSFGFEYTVDPPTDKSVWVQSICSTSKCTIKNLEPGKRYWFRTFVTGARGQQIMGEMMLSPYVQ